MSAAFVARTITAAEVTTEMVSMVAETYADHMVSESNLAGTRIECAECGVPIMVDHGLTIQEHAREAVRTAIVTALGLNAS